MIRRSVLQLVEPSSSPAACRTCIGRRILNISTDFAGHTVGIREVRGRIRLIGFLDYDLGYFDNERDRVEPGPNPFVPDKVLTMCPEQGVNHVTGIHPEKTGAPGRIDSSLRSSPLRGAFGVQTGCAGLSNEGRLLGREHTGKRLGPRKGAQVIYWRARQDSNLRPPD